MFTAYAVTVALILAYNFTTAVTAKHPRPLPVFLSAVAVLVFAAMMNLM